MELLQYFKKDMKGLKECMGDISQLCGIREYELKDGKMKSVRALDVYTGSGLRFTILPDRGMDIAWADYQGIPLSYISKTGVVSPYFYDSKGSGFMKNFYAGLLTTCGLSYMGASCYDQGEELGLHGQINNIPAENVNISCEWEQDEYVMSVTGKIRETRVFGPNLVLRRTYKTGLGSKKIEILDTVENCGFDKEPLMLLYHFNLGYPILSEHSKLIIPSQTVSARDEEAQKGIENWMHFDKPTYGFKEQVFYHTLEQEAEKYALLYNPQLKDGLGVKISYNSPYLNKFIEWKMIGQGEYVLGIEPATWTVEGRNVAREKGELLYIAPSEKMTFQFTIDVIESM